MGDCSGSTRPGTHQPSNAHGMDRWPPRLKTQFIPPSIHTLSQASLASTATGQTFIAPSERFEQLRRDREREAWLRESSLTPISECCDGNHSRNAQREKSRTPTAGSVDGTHTSRDSNHATRQSSTRHCCCDDCRKSPSHISASRHTEYTTTVVPTNGSGNTSTLPPLRSGRRSPMPFTPHSGYEASASGITGTHVPVPLSTDCTTQRSRSATSRADSDQSTHRTYDWKNPSPDDQRFAEVCTHTRFDNKYAMCKVGSAPTEFYEKCERPAKYGKDGTAGHWSEGLGSGANAERMSRSRSDTPLPPAQRAEHDASGPHRKERSGDRRPALPTNSDRSDKSEKTRHSDDDHKRDNVRGERNSDRERKDHGERHKVKSHTVDRNDVSSGRNKKDKSDKNSKASSGKAPKSYRDGSTRTTEGERNDLRTREDSGSLRAKSSKSPSGQSGTSSGSSRPALHRSDDNTGHRQPSSPSPLSSAVVMTSAISSDALPPLLPTTTVPSIDTRPAPLTIAAVTSISSSDDTAYSGMSSTTSCSTVGTWVSAHDRIARDFPTFPRRQRRGASGESDGRAGLRRFLDSLRSEPHCGRLKASAVFRSSGEQGSSGLPSLIHGSGDEGSGGSVSQTKAPSAQSEGRTSDSSKQSGSATRSARPACEISRQQQVSPPDLSARQATAGKKYDQRQELSLSRKATSREATHRAMDTTSTNCGSNDTPCPSRPATTDLATVRNSKPLPPLPSSYSLDDGSDLSPAIMQIIKAHSDPGVSHAYIRWRKREERREKVRQLAMESQR